MTEKPQDPKELERRKLLEEIRRRSEEAEMRRIESEEEKTAFEIPEPEEEPTEPVPVEAKPTPPPPHPHPPEPVDEYRLIELRGKFAVSIDRKDVEAASDVILDLASIIPDTVELASYEKKLRSLRIELKEARVRPPAAPAEDEEAREGKERKKQVRAKKIRALMEESLSLYEQEKYDRASARVNELLEMDPENEDAIGLRSNIEKAQDLAAEVRAEEARRKADEAADRPGPEPVAEPSVGERSDFWGAAEDSPADAEFGLPGEKDTAAVKSKVPLRLKIVERASRIQVPVKPIVFATIMILAIIGGYYLAGEIQSSAGELTSSLVVLPGWYAPSDSLAGYLSYSLAEQITAELSRTADLRIIATHTAAAVRYIRGGPAAAARSVGVVHYLHWNIQTTPASVTFDVTLRDTGRVEPVWSARKQSSIRELPSAIREIAAGILTAMDLSSSGEEATTGRAGSTGNPDAFLRYLEGRFMLANPRRYATMDAAVLFDRALQEDPEFVEARVSKAWCYLLQAESSSDSPTSLVADAAGMLNDGSSLAASSASIVATHGLLQQLQGGYDKAIGFLNSGIRSFPGDAELRRRLSTVAMMRGDGETAVANARLAVQLDPLNVESYMVLGAVHKFEGDDQLALEAYRRAATISPAADAFKVMYFPELFASVHHHDSAEVILSSEIGRSREDYVLYYRLGRVYQAAGRNIARWEEVLERSRDLIVRRLSTVPDDGIARSYLALVLTRLGRQKDAETELNRALSDQRDHPAVLYNAARAYAMQKQFPLSLEYLDKAIGLRYDPDLVFDMDFYNLRKEADFQSVVIR